jgi:nucleoside-diphosphate-sugar epimerase
MIGTRITPRLIQGYDVMIISLFLDPEHPQQKTKTIQCVAVPQRLTQDAVSSEDNVG